MYFHMKLKSFFSRESLKYTLFPSINSKRTESPYRNFLSYLHVGHVRKIGTKAVSHPEPNPVRCPVLSLRLVVFVPLSLSCSGLGTHYHLCASGFAIPMTAESCFPPIHITCFRWSVTQKLEKHLVARPYGAVYNMYLHCFFFYKLKQKCPLIV